MRNTIWLVFIFFGGLTGVQAIEKQARDFQEFKLWQKLLHYSLSPDGEWAMWNILYGENQDTLFLRNIQTDKEYKYGKASMLVFSGNSRWATFTVPAGKPLPGQIAYMTRLLDLKTGEEKDFSDAESCAFTPDSKCLILKGSMNGEVRDLNLYQLERKLTKNLANVGEYTTDPTGKYMVYTVKTHSGQGNGVELMNLSNLQVTFLENANAEYEKLQWDDKGLIFTKVMPDSVRENRSREIFVVKGAGAKQRIFHLSSDSIQGFPTGMKISEYYAPRWSGDGKILFLGISRKQESPREPKDKTAEVDIWHWQDEQIQSRQQNRYYSNRGRTLLCAWLPEQNQLIRIADTSIIDITEISPDGHYVLAEDDSPYRPHFRESHQDIYLIHTFTGKRVRLLKNTILSCSFSREGKYVYYFEDRNWWAYDIIREKRINLTDAVPHPLNNTYYDGPIDISPSFGSAGWLKDDKAFWFYDDYDIWSVEPANLNLQRLTRGREERITFRKLQKAPLRSDAPVLLKADGDDGQIGIYRYHKGKVEQLIYGPHNLLRLSEAVDHSAYLFAREDNITSAELFVCDADFKALRQLSRTNLPQEGYRFRKSELVHYENPQGQALKGALFYPVNYEEGKKYPMIVHIYETLSQKLNDFVYPFVGDAYNTTNYVLQGYFVFQPDITYRVNHPGESAVECVNAAVREVIGRGDIDTSAIGLIGHSWGAYQSAYIATQTSPFAAVIAGAPLTDMVSMYNSVYWEDGRANQEMFETSQARFRQPWWEIPDDYIVNSPVFQAGKATTPLLILFGTNDNSVNWSQGLEMYITMRRLGKPCILVAYQDEGHTIGTQPNAEDQARRVFDYFDYYLKKQPGAEWITKGRSYLEKKARK